jgi:hypothetical protein
MPFGKQNYVQPTLFDEDGVGYHYLHLSEAAKDKLLNTIVGTAKNVTNTLLMKTDHEFVGMEWQTFNFQQKILNKEDCQKIPVSVKRYQNKNYFSIDFGQYEDRSYRCPEILKHAYWVVFENNSQPVAHVLISREKFVIIAHQPIAVSSNVSIPSLFIHSLSDIYILDELFFDGDCFIFANRIIFDSTVTRMTAGNDITLYSAQESVLAGKMMARFVEIKAGFFEGHGQIVGTEGVSITSEEFLRIGEIYTNKTIQLLGLVFSAQTSDLLYAPEEIKIIAGTYKQAGLFATDKLSFFANDSQWNGDLYVATLAQMKTQGFLDVRSSARFYFSGSAELASQCALRYAGKMYRPPGINLSDGKVRVDWHEKLISCSKHKIILSSPHMLEMSGDIHANNVNLLMSCEQLEITGKIWNQRNTYSAQSMGLCLEGRQIDLSGKGKIQASDFAVNAGAFTQQGMISAKNTNVSTKKLYELKQNAELNVGGRLMVQSEEMNTKKDSRISFVDQFYFQGDYFRHRGLLTGDNAFIDAARMIVLHGKCELYNLYCITPIFFSTARLSIEHEFSITGYLVFIAGFIKAGVFSDNSVVSCKLASLVIQTSVLSPTKATFWLTLVNTTLTLVNLFIPGARAVTLPIQIGLNSAVQLYSIARMVKYLREQTNKSLQPSNQQLIKVVTAISQLFIAVSSIGLSMWGSSKSIQQLVQKPPKVDFQLTQHFAEISVIAEQIGVALSRAISGCNSSSLIGISALDGFFGASQSATHIASLNLLDFEATGASSNNSLVTASGGCYHAVGAENTNAYLDVMSGGDTLTPTHSSVSTVGPLYFVSPPVKELAEYQRASIQSSEVNFVCGKTTFTDTGITTSGDVVISKEATVAFKDSALLAHETRDAGQLQLDHSQLISDVKNTGNMKVTRSVVTAPTFINSGDLQIVNSAVRTGKFDNLGHITVVSSLWENTIYIKNRGFMAFIGDRVEIVMFDNQSKGELQIISSNLKMSTCHDQGLVVLAGAKGHLNQITIDNGGIFAVQQHSDVVVDKLQVGDHSILVVDGSKSVVADLRVANGAQVGITGSKSEVGRLINEGDIFIGVSDKTKSNDSSILEIAKLNNTGRFQLKGTTAKITILTNEKTGEIFMVDSTEKSNTVDNQGTFQTLKSSLEIVELIDEGLAGFVESKGRLNHVVIERGTLVIHQSSDIGMGMLHVGGNGVLAIYDSKSKIAHLTVATDGKMGIAGGQLDVDTFTNAGEVSITGGDKTKSNYRLILQIVNANNTGRFQLRDTVAEITTLTNGKTGEILLIDSSGQICTVDNQSKLQIVKSSFVVDKFTDSGMAGFFESHVDLNHVVIKDGTLVIQQHSDIMVDTLQVGEKSVLAIDDSKSKMTHLTVASGAQIGITGSQVSAKDLINNGDVYVAKSFDKAMAGVPTLTIETLRNSGSGRFQVEDTTTSIKTINNDKASVFLAIRAACQFTTVDNQGKMQFVLSTGSFQTVKNHDKAVFAIDACQFEIQSFDNIDSAVVGVRASTLLMGHLMNGNKFSVIFSDISIAQLSNGSNAMFDVNTSILFVNQRQLLSASLPKFTTTVDNNGVIVYTQNDLNKPLLLANHTFFTCLQLRFEANVINVRGDLVAMDGLNLRGTQIDVRDARVTLGDSLWAATNIEIHDSNIVSSGNLMFSADKGKISIGGSNITAVNDLTLKAQEINIVGRTTEQITYEEHWRWHGFHSGYETTIIRRIIVTPSNLGSILGNVCLYATDGGIRLESTNLFGIKIDLFADNISLRNTLGGITKTVDRDGLFSSSHSEEFHPIATPNVFFSTDDVNLHAKGDIDAPGLLVKTEGKFIVIAGHNIVFSRDILEHEIKYQGWGFSINAPIDSLFAGSNFDLLSSMPLLQAARQLAVAGVSGGGFSAVSFLAESLNQLNSLVGLIRVGESPVNIVGSIFFGKNPLDKFFSLQFSLSREKYTQTFQTLGSGAVQAGSIVISSGNKLSIENAFELKASKITLAAPSINISGAALTSRMDSEQAGISGSFSIFSGISGGSIHYQHLEAEKVTHVLSEINCETLTISTRELDVKNAKLSADVLVGHVDKVTLMTEINTQKSSDVSAGFGLNGSFSMGGQHSKIETMEEISELTARDVSAFTVGILENIGGKTNINAKVIIEHPLLPLKHSEHGISLSGNISDFASSTHSNGVDVWKLTLNNNGQKIEMGIPIFDKIALGQLKDNIDWFLHHYDSPSAIISKTNTQAILLSPPIKQVSHVTHKPDLAPVPVVTPVKIPSRTQENLPHVSRIANTSSSWIDELSDIGLTMLGIGTAHAAERLEMNCVLTRSGTLSNCVWVNQDKPSRFNLPTVSFQNEGNKDGHSFIIPPEQRREEKQLADELTREKMNRYARDQFAKEMHEEEQLRDMLRRINLPNNRCVEMILLKICSHLYM